MSANSWQVARLDEIERRNRGIPVREHLGIRAFGIGAFVPGDDGTIISDHDEKTSGQQELYIVLDGTATFTIDGKELETTAGTLVFVDPATRRAAKGSATVLAIGGVPGAAYHALDWGDAWPLHNESMRLYGEHRYADAAETVRKALAQYPDQPGLHYNYACFAALAGETGDDVFEHLRRSAELYPHFRAQAREDDDFAPVRDDPRFEEALR